MTTLLRPYANTSHPMTAAAETAALPLLDRDLSWLEFNRRVLHEALDPRTPLLERVKFLGIFNSNLDEFFMKRVGRLKREIDEQTEEQADADADGPYRRLLRIRDSIRPMLATQADLYTREIRPELARHGIYLLAWADLDEVQRKAARDYFRRNVFPVLTPLAVDPGHPFPFISNMSTSLGITLRAPDSDENLFARVKVPDVFPQWVVVPGAASDGRPGTQSFVKLLDIIRHNLDDLFPGMTLLEVMPFRITRNIEVEQDEDEPPVNLAAEVEEELRQRRFQRPVRLEHGAPASATQLQLLARKLDLGDADLYEMPAEIDYNGLFAIAGLNRPELRDRPWTPLIPAPLADEDADIFAAIRAGDLLVHHPYESFDATVARFIRSAAVDPKVLALKMTVYRVGADTPLLDALVQAAENGKQVACLVELTARLDERQNLLMAHKLEKVGVHVVYGVVGLKTHAKTTLVVRRDEDGLRCYAHIGTGNYHVKNARIYTDLGLLTCDPVLTGDVVDLFHHLTGRSIKSDYARLLVAPINMRRRFLELIERETAHRKAGRPARIIAKMNQLQDEPICAALVRASQAGVPIDLLVRGFCVLPPQVAGITDNVRIVSVIGRFLEHSRIYYFQNGQEDSLAGDYFIGSADWMERNLSDRVEAVTPIELRPHRERLWEILQIMLRDHRQAWDMKPDGSYVQRTAPANAEPGSPEVLGTHQTLMNLTAKRGEPAGATA
jgi:polyphosphate kinase